MTMTMTAKEWEAVLRKMQDDSTAKRELLVRGLIVVEPQKPRLTPEQLKAAEEAFIAARAAHRND